VAGAVGSGVATTYDGSSLMRTVDHGLDLDDLAPGHGPRPQEHHS
jgi:hypothetical protein